MTLSVLICTYNRHELLVRALHSVIEGTVEKPDQVVVVNGGDGRADEVVSSFVGRHGIEVKLIKTVNKNLATSRNVGLSHCTGDIIAMTDDDAEVFPDWVTRMKCLHREHPEAGAVGGLVLGTNTKSLVGKVADAITFPSWSGPRYVRTLPGVNVSYKREVVEKLGPQDEALLRGEDVDYNWRVQKLDYQIYFDPDVKVYHHHRPTFKAHLNQHYMYGRAYYFVRRKWPEMYSVYPHGIKRTRDLLKAANFACALFYQPVLSAFRMPTALQGLRTLPLLFATGVAWKGGMLLQMAQAKWSRRPDTPPQKGRYSEGA
jgi:GT2 family glycosyltransferase